MKAEEKLKHLYQKVILGHSKHPYHYEKMEGPDHIIEAYNPLCGDKFKLFLKMKDDRIETASFSGYGCAISKASTSILVQRLEGLRLADIDSLRQQFRAVALENEGSDDEEFEAFSAAKEFPGRATCVSLSWDSLEEWQLESK